MYTCVHAYFSAWSIPSGTASYCASCGNSANPVTTGASTYFAVYNNAGTYVWRFGYHIATGWQFITGTAAVQLNTWYRLEFEINNGTLSARVDGTQIGSPVSGVTLDRGTPRYWHAGTYFGGTATITYYLDLFAVDNADWVGAESAGGLSIPKLMRYYQRLRTA